MDVDERYEYDRDSNLRPGEHAGHELGKFDMAVDVLGVGGVEGRDTTERKVYGFHSALHDIV